MASRRHVAYRRRKALFRKELGQMIVGRRILWSAIGETDATTLTDLLTGKD